MEEQFHSPDSEQKNLSHRLKSVQIGEKYIAEFLDSLYDFFYTFRKNKEYDIRWWSLAKAQWVIPRPGFYEEHLACRARGKAGLTIKIQRVFRDTNREEEITCECKRTKTTGVSNIRFKSPGKYVELDKLFSLEKGRIVLVYCKNGKTSKSFHWKYILFDNIPKDRFKDANDETAPNLVLCNVSELGGSWKLLDKRYPSDIDNGTIDEQIDKLFSMEATNGDKTNSGLPRSMPSGKSRKSEVHSKPRRKKDRDNIQLPSGNP